ncbi:MAG: glycosyltransferase family 9 protein [Deltaproteobacteria bacterium]|nr:glycosyltransferase family 9 protein [Deltaproteobacteria bacterium]
MKLKGKLALDHYVGAPLAWALNIVARIVSSVIKRDHSLTKPPRTILFTKYLGLGSIVRASFLISAAKRTYPDAKIAFATFPGCAALAKMYDDVDEVLVVRENKARTLFSDTVKLLLWCWKNKVDLVVDLEVHSKYSSLIAACSLARDRAGFGGITSRFRSGLYSHLVYWNPIRFVDHAYRQLGAAIKLDMSEPAPVPSVTLESRLEMEEYLKRIGVKDGDILFGINPNSSDLRTERKWPLEHFAKVIEALPEKDTLHVMLLGSPAERSYTEKLLAACPKAKVKVHNCAGDLPFPAFCALLTRLSLLLTNDSGPMHLARAFGVPTVTLWGPTHPLVYSPRGKDNISLYQPIYCSPCTHFSDVPPCGGDNQCLKRLSWKRAARACFKMLEIPLTEELVHAKKAEDPESMVYGHWPREAFSSRGEDASS